MSGLAAATVLPLQTLPAEPLVIVALVLALLGVVGSLVPGVPGALLSLAGVGVYWWTAGDAAPALALAALAILGLLALAADWLGGAVAAAATGVSHRVVVAAALVGLVGGLAAGPVGLLVGVAGTVFVAALAAGNSPRASARTAAVAAVGVLGSALLQAALTGALFLGLLWIVL